MGNFVRFSAHQLMSALFLIFSLFLTAIVDRQDALASPRMLHKEDIKKAQPLPPEDPRAQLRSLIGIAHGNFIAACTDFKIDNLKETLEEKEMIAMYSELVIDIATVGTSLYLSRVSRGAIKSAVGNQRLTQIANLWISLDASPEKAKMKDIALDFLKKQAADPVREMKQKIFSLPTDSEFDKSVNLIKAAHNDYIHNVLTSIKDMSVEDVEMYKIYFDKSATTEDVYKERLTPLLKDIEYIHSIGLSEDILDEKFTVRNVVFPAWVDNNGEKRLAIVNRQMQPGARVCVVQRIISTELERYAMDYYRSVLISRIKKFRSASSYEPLLSRILRGIFKVPKVDDADQLIKQLPTENERLVQSLPEECKKSQ